jgi:DNA mismatch repair ATPase MutS
MQTDQQTLKDLEIFHASDNGLSVFETLDRTITKGGKNRLNERFKQPLNSLEQINETQETVKYLAEHLQQWRFPVSDQKLQSLDRYTSSNIDPIEARSKSASLPDTIMFYFSDKDAFNYLKESIAEVSEIVESFTKLFRQNAGNNLPALLYAWQREIYTFASDPQVVAISELCRKGIKPGFREVCYFDSILRRRLKPVLIKVVAAMYDLDALLSMAKITDELGFCFPEISEEESMTLKAEGLYHIFLKNPVKCDIAIGNEKNFLFLTGPNMAGKTTFLKSLGVAVYLAHLGMSVPAQKFRLVCYDRLISSISISDSIRSGYSYFFSEVKRVKDVAQALSKGEKVLAIFDELFKGTNVKDAYDASAMIINGLVLWNKSLFILSSHLSELWAEIANKPSITSMYFESEIINNAPVFTYKLATGVSNMRLGSTIIENEKIMDLLIPKQHDNI